MDEFIADAVATISASSRYTTEQIRVAVRLLVEWAYHRAALPLESDIIFDPYTIERFVASGLPHYTNHGRNTIRSRLRNATAILLEESPTSMPLVQYGSSPGSRPYLDREIARFKSWAALQPSDERRRSAEALLALGFGAGMSGREIIRAHIGDAECTTDGVVIRVRGSKPRMIPVLPEWCRSLDEHIAVGTAAAFMFRPQRRSHNENLITDFVARSRTTVNLTARRMHATWVIDHLDSGTALIPFLRAAGLSSPEALDRFLPYAREWSDAEFTAAIRREVTPPQSAT